MGGCAAITSAGEPLSLDYLTEVVDGYMGSFHRRIPVQRVPQTGGDANNPIHSSLQRLNGTERLVYFSIASNGCVYCIYKLILTKEIEVRMANGILQPTLPTEADANLARETSRVLAARLKKRDPLRLRILDEAVERTVNLPASAVQILVRILEEMARGNAVTLIPVHAELTTQEAADMLNISRPSLIQLLDEGKIEYRRVGTHRRVRFEAVMAYKRLAHDDRKRVLAKLAAYDEELGI